MTIADQLTALANVKTAIRSAIVAQGVSVADDATFASYADRVLDIEVDSAPVYVKYLSRRLQESLTDAALAQLDIDTTGANDLSNMFYSCALLTSIPMLDTSVTSTFTGMFQYCTALESIPTLNTSSGTGFMSMFQGCSSLKSIPALNLSSGLAFSNMFNGCTKVTSIHVTGFTRSISVSSCVLLNADALNEIFTNAGTSINSSQTITVTGCAGAATCNPSIAIDKGWSVNL